MIKKIIILTFGVITTVIAQQGTPIDLRLNSIAAEARKAFGIKNDIANQRKAGKTDTDNTITTLKDQLRNSRQYIDQNIEDLKKIIFSDL